MLDTISKQGSTEQDIDNLLNKMHDDVRYIHVRFDAQFDKSTWRSAFLRNLQRGFYKATEQDQRRILNSIAGKDHYAIEYAHGTLDETGQWVQDKPQLVVFGFTDGKISLIRELW